MFLLTSLYIKKNLLVDALVYNPHIIVAKYMLSFSKCKLFAYHL